jgi:hypothetical protein
VDAVAERRRWGEKGGGIREAGGRHGHGLWRRREKIRALKWWIMVS